MIVIRLLNNIVLRGRGFCTSSIAQITGNVPRLLADIVGKRFDCSMRCIPKTLFTIKGNRKSRSRENVMPHDTLIEPNKVKFIDYCVVAEF